MMNQQPFIRAAEAADALRVAQIYVDSWNAGFVGLMPERPCTDELVRRWERDLTAGPPHRWWVAVIDDQVVGFAGIGPSRDPLDATLGELDTIAVTPARWRRGIGQSLMAVAFDALQTDGYREAVLWTLAGYPLGQRFYESLGWETTGATRADGRQIQYRHALHEGGVRMHITSRPFADARDLDAILALIAARPVAALGDAPTLVEVQEWLALPSVQAMTQVWHDTSSVLGYAFLNPSNYLFFEMRHDANTSLLGTQMIAWGEQQVLGQRRETGEAATLSAVCHEGDEQRARLLTAHGFVLQPWIAVDMVRSLSEPIAMPQFPDGFFIRAVAGDVDVPTLVHLHRAAFGTEEMTEEYRLAMMRTPDYDPALDLVVVAPDGTLVAACVCSINGEENRLTGRNDGATDPIVTHPAFQRRGLARALLLAGLELLKQRGVGQVHLSTSGENVAMLALARDVGFEVHNRTLFFDKTVTAPAPGN